MTADKRNAVVVIALIVSMTVGAGVLLLLEPANKPRWEGFPQLMAECATPVQAVQVAYAASDEDPAALDDGRHSLCVIDGEGEVTWMARATLAGGGGGLSDRRADRPAEGQVAGSLGQPESGQRSGAGSCSTGSGVYPAVQPGPVTASGRANVRSA